MNEQDILLRLGQRLGVGFDGYEIPDEYRQLIQKYKIGNVILFRRNVQSFQQLKRLCADLTALIREETGFDPFIMIDEECGSVSRLSHITVPTPSAMAIGATNDPDNAYRIGKIMGDELRSAGINFNLAPVLDCFTNQDNSVCGNRCFATDPDKVALFGCRYIDGLRDAGVIACGKHFPGHGDTDVDSHLALPIVNKSLENMRAVELKPFAAAIRAGIPSIMSAHVVFPAIEPDRVPSTVSRKVMTGLLRQEMGFDGLIISDAIEMKAVLDLFGIEEGTRRALDAGIDIALICHSAQQATDAMEHLLKCRRDGTFSEENISEHYQRIVACKRQYTLPEGEIAFGTEDQRRQAREIMDASIQLLHAPEGKPLPGLDEHTLFFGTMARRNALVNDDIPLNAAEEFAKAFGARSAGLEPPEDTQAHTAVVFLGRHPEAGKTIAAARRLAEKGVQVVAVSMWTPRALKDLPDSVWKIAAWQYDDLAVESLLRKYEELK